MLALASPRLIDYSIGGIDYKYSVDSVVFSKGPRVQHPVLVKDSTGIVLLLYQLEKKEIEGR